MDKRGGLPDRQFLNGTKGVRRNLSGSEYNTPQQFVRKSLFTNGTPGTSRE